jgi:hypothetical protein
VTGSVDSQNSFGALIRTTFGCIWKPQKSDDGNEKSFVFLDYADIRWIAQPNDSTQRTQSVWLNPNTGRSAP